MKDKKSKSTAMINMNYPTSLVERIDRYKEDNGFTTRTNAIIHLILTTLENKGY